MKKINSTLFKKSLSKFTTGVTIITINKDGVMFGKTVNSFAALSLNPPLVLFSLDKKSSSIEKYLKSKNIGINLLSNKQKNISSYFSLKNSSWNNTKYIVTKKNSIPMIKDCVANFHCKKYKVIKEGDHFLFICKILEIQIDNTKKPLIYFNSKYL